MLWPKFQAEEMGTDPHVGNTLFAVKKTPVWGTLAGQPRQAELRCAQRLIMELILRQCQQLFVRLRLGGPEERSVPPVGEVPTTQKEVAVTIIMK